MTTITKEFTKEQLIEHITRNSDQISREIKATPKGDNAYNEKILAVNEIALAALTASERPLEDLRRSFEAVVRLNNEMYRWTSCMSYNGSYVGEPEGLLKRNIREIEHIMDSCRASMLNVERN